MTIQSVKYKEVIDFMEKIFIALYYIIFVITVAYAIYFTVTGFLGIILKSKVKFKSARKNNHFAILIAARNEEVVIGNLIESLVKQNYPKDKFDIYVIPNSCTDNTSKVAKKAGAKVIECTVKTKTKGDVLKFAFDKLKDNKEIDAYLIFDADNVVHPDFLKHMNDCLASGYRVAEGYRDAKNPKDNWLSGSYTLFYLFQNVFFNRARMAIGGSSSINGTGFMIKKEIIDRDGFETYSLTEDVEYTGQCALKGERIAFVEDAITYDEYPVKFDASWRQRKRWSSGILTCLKLYSPKLFVNYLKTKKLASLDMAIVYFGPMFQLLNFVNIAMLSIFQLLNLKMPMFSSEIRLGFLYFIFVYLFSITLEIFILLYKKKNIMSVWRGILLFPVFIITWIPINLVCLTVKQTSWEEIKHDRSVNINDVMNK